MVEGVEYCKRQDGKYQSSLTRSLLADELRLKDFNSKIEMIDLLYSYKQRAGDEYYLQMTESEIRKLSESKWVTIGSHSYFHSDLSKLSAIMASEELINSRKFLEKTIDKEVNAFAFPYGSYTKEILNETKKAGYTKILAGKFLFQEDAEEPTLRERFTINPFISNINQLYANIRGRY
jgi:hypothetical protein